MFVKRLPRLMGVTLILLILLSVMNATAAGIIVPATRLDDQRMAITIDDLKPSACAGLALGNIESGAGFIFGTNGNDLILGSSGGDIIFALNGNDCILSGGGNDWIFGGPGNDVCLSGAGTDTFDQCETQNQ
jgi:hypothetical protein